MEVNPEQAALEMFGRAASSEQFFRFLDHVWFVDGRVAGHLGAAVGLKTLSIHVCVCPHFGM